MTVWPERQWITYKHPNGSTSSFPIPKAWQAVNTRPYRADTNPTGSPTPQEPLRGAKDGWVVDRKTGEKSGLTQELSL